MEHSELEARDNIRLAIKASLMFDTFGLYKTWANEYLKSNQGLLIEVPGEIEDIAHDTINMYKSWQPWFSCGRMVDTCNAILKILLAVKAYHPYPLEQYQNASNWADEALGKLGEIHKRMEKELCNATQLVRKSLVGENAV